ncbi:GGDEF domain-containing protein [Paenibacillus harenae]|uniref:GGDEF domain-containing protein n=1 Tax=Paenibacillus harenae TaxID=306543 RepID=UPI0027902614|nr:GGDEF domain-containing protein [Paenibacillus harenae]MDQ0061897.1 diguanylate cyclase (GGDEF)-like protein [Paenibacillus harenae]
MNFKNDHFLERIFSLLRWFFLVVAGIVYVFYYLQTKEDTWRFALLLGFGLLYMGTAEWVLLRAPRRSPRYSAMTKLAVGADMAAYIALIAFTGGTSSPLLPIAYLIILHASIYWNVRGGILTALIMNAACFAITLLQPADGGPDRLLYLALNSCFFLLVGLLGGLIVARERRYRNEKRFYQELAKRDYLTGLHNHRAFQENLQTQLRLQKPFTLVMADIDHFKKINDQYGHITGDLVLKQVGHLLEACIPDKQGTVYRYGGEEFAIILHTQQEDAANRLLENFRNALSQISFESIGASFGVTMSFGAVIRSEEWTDDVVKAADLLLYSAKKQGRNCIVWGVANR